MWENFGGGKFWRINNSKVFGKKKFGKSVSSLLKTLAFINIGGENFGELPTVRQNFPTYCIIIPNTLPKFPINGTTCICVIKNI